MKKIIHIVFAIIFIQINLFAEYYDGYDNRNIISYENDNIKVLCEVKDSQYEDAPNLIVSLIKDNNVSVLNKYEFEGNVASVKHIEYDKKKSILGILVGWRTMHRGLGIDGEYYSLKYYRLFDSFFLPLDKISKAGFDGSGEDGKETFLFKSDESIAKYTSSITENNLLENINDQIKNNQKQFDINSIKIILKEIKITKKTLVMYNDMAYYLEKEKAYEEAVYVLEKIVEKFPNRTVAYLNLGDAYWGLEDKYKAKKAYQTYIKQMREKGKEKKIPNIILQRVR